jgi:hypothetical protein
MLNDRRLAWDLDSEGHYHQRKPGSPEQEVGCHDLLAEKARLRTPNPVPRP